MKPRVHGAPYREVVSGQGYQIAEGLGPWAYSHMAVYHWTSFPCVPWSRSQKKVRGTRRCPSWGTPSVPFSNKGLYTSCCIKKCLKKSIFLQPSTKRLIQSRKARQIMLFYSHSSVAPCFTQSENEARHRPSTWISCYTLFSPLGSVVAILAFLLFLAHDLVLLEKLFSRDTCMLTSLLPSIKSLLKC